ncbi:transmembrane protein 183-like [Mizuhopecten yessoensis]|uniref:Transmembrane protein 183 n=1 Tax=Mizuhopecten yessoensis TaxID=6573 RepID=A0A210QHX3_MIZYE|nr:transmembrane protein 183-like [Mizuhopecten yessoensis]OWF48363.1 Transmembrane protein 183 [Mizuhopecten yessoensis]
MPRKSRPSKITKSAGSTIKFSTQSDFTIHHYANAEGKAPPGRIKKAAANAMISEAHSIKNSKQALELVGAVGEDASETSWFDKDLDEIDINTDSTDQQSEDGVEEPVPETKLNRRKRRLKGSESEDTGISYPIDLWYVLSRYVHPEDLTVFFRLNHSTFSVSSTIQFWRGLYKRYAKDLSKLPDYLQPICLERIHGLRQRVIRALFFVYPVLISRTITVAPFQDQQLCYNLTGHLCLVSWHERNKNMWNFNFKFRKERMGEINSLLRLKGEPQSLRSGYSDLHHNLENDSYVLCATCKNFTAIPPVMGLVLTNLMLRLSASMRYLTLRLLFDTTLKQGMGANVRESQSLEKVVILDPVVDIRVFPWWHPNYPHQGM